MQYCLSYADLFHRSLILLWRWRSLVFQRIVVKNRPELWMITVRCDFTVSLRKVRECLSVSTVSVIVCVGFNPVWEETLSFTLHMPEVALVRFLVWDHDPIGRDFVGQRTVAFSSLMPGKRFCKSFFCNYGCFYCFKLTNSTLCIFDKNILLCCGKCYVVKVTFWRIFPH